MSTEPPAKRVKLENPVIDKTVLRAQRAAFLDSLSRPVSPPSGQSARSTSFAKSSGSVHAPAQMSRRPVTSVINESEPEKEVEQAASKSDRKSSGAKPSHQLKTRVQASPVQLSKINNLPSSENVDAISLSDLLGDPLIKEAWIFNFCFDVDWLMQYFDPDVRDLVEVKIVHGSWRKGDTNKIGIDDACSRRSNVKAIQAYLPDAFGTHHSKMFILFRHDDCAQVIIHTANMLSKDWTNMTQAIWRSPLLPLVKKDFSACSDNASVGPTFKNDLSRYIKAYGNKLKPLLQQLQTYDFNEVKGALVASVPAKFKISASDNEVWGHEMLRRKIRDTNLESRSSNTRSHFVFQVSSIASLTTHWLEETLYSACGSSKQSTSIIFPTAHDVARSLDGYAAGGSIHTKAQSAAHLKQISTLRPQLCRWTPGLNPIGQAGRDLAAPHIKTYIRFAVKSTEENCAPEVDWALTTSANLSMQAWGSTPKIAKGEKDSNNAIVHIQSYEIGVLVWPELFRDELKSMDEHALLKMVPVFKRDLPDVTTHSADIVIGFRMPYDLPLTPYAASELPWSPQSSYDVPDRHGRIWQ